MLAVSVIIPALNAADTISDTLAALRGQGFCDPYEVIVVDDGSEDDTARIAERAGDGVIVIRQPRQGPGPARNRGAAEARGEVLAFTDADCVPAEDWLAEGLVAVADADLAQGRVEPDPGTERGPFDHTVAVGREGGLYETANLFVRRELFEQLEGFEDLLNARIGKPLAEDVWFGWRARRAGARTAFCERALVHHAIIRRKAGAYIVERLRLVYFPVMVAKIPELREHFFFHRWFLTNRSAAFDAALAGAGVAVALSSPWPLLTGAPYLRLLARRAWPWRRHAPKVAVVDLVADAVGLGALLWGTLRERSPVF